MVAGMGGKGKKPGGDMEDKLSEALRRAEEAVLRDGKLRDEEEKSKKKKPAGRKPLDMKDLMPPKAAQAKKPSKTPKPAPEVPTISFDRRQKPEAPGSSMPAAAALPRPAKPAVPQKPAEPAKPAEGKKAAPSLGFGMLDLGGGTADAPELELATTETTPQEKTVEEPEEKPAEEPPAQLESIDQEPPGAAPPEPPRTKPLEPEPPRRSEASREYVPTAPKRSHAREIKILLLILLAVFVVGAGVYGFLKWRESVDAEQAALNEQIDSASREALMDDTIKKEKYK